MDLIKWQLNFRLCNFGLKSYLWSQIELTLRIRSILKSHVWFQTKLHSTQLSYTIIHWYCYLTPNYHGIKFPWLKCKPKGVTFLALGNGSPDIFSALAAISNSRNPNEVQLGMQALFGKMCSLYWVVFIGHSGVFKVIIYLWSSEWGIDMYIDPIQILTSY